MAIFSKNLSISKALLDELKTSYNEEHFEREIKKGSSEMMDVSKKAREKRHL